MPNTPGMIVCVSANPGLDRRVRIHTFVPGQVNRAAEAEAMPGGKAAHVAIASRALGVKTAWIGFLGAATGEQLGAQLARLKIEVVSIKTRAATRVNLELIEGSGRITEVLEPGTAPDPKETQQMLDTFAELLRGAWKGALVVISGSLPSGMPNDFYAQLMNRAAEAGSKVFLDTSGEALAVALKAGPALLKSNRDETEALLGKALSRPEDALAACHQFLERGAQSAAVTLGPNGLVWLESKGGTAWVAKPPKMEAISTVGCGDVTLAGFGFAALQRWTGEKAIRFATACGAANCVAPHAGEISAKIVSDLLPRIELEATQL
jgi:1-phosphofructokinase family hexose kinase